MSNRTFLHKLARSLKSRPRLLVSTLIGVATFLASPLHWRLETRGLVSWDVAVMIYLALFFQLARNAGPEHIRRQARLQDDGALLTLILSSVAASVCFAAIAFELAAVKGMMGTDKVEHLTLVAVTIPVAWLFIHSMFALHYAHVFYSAVDSRGHGLIFPGDQPPSYWDFIYFSFIIGTSGQTADVSISCPSIRRLATIHCTFAFFYNITTLGLTINVASGLI